MCRHHATAVGLVIAIALISCGGDEGEERLSPSTSKPIVQKQRTLSAAEYPAVREWIIGSGTSSAERRPICEGLDAAPSTPVVRAARNACDRILSITIDLEGITEQIRGRCPGDYQCAARILAGSYRRQYVNVRRVFSTYYADIANVVQKGPCRIALAPPEDLKEFDSGMRRFDDAVAQLARGNRAAFDRLDSSEADLDDPTPCRPS